MIDLDNLERTLELANDYVDDGLHFLTEPVSYGELKLLAERLISAEKDAARYRSAVSMLGEASEMLQLLSLSVSKVSERNMERIDAVVCEIDAELSQCNK